MKKRVFFVDEMPSTPFCPGDIKKLSFPGDIGFTKDWREADVFVGRSLALLRPYLHLDKGFYIWTHEPAWLSLNGHQFVDIPTGKTIHFSNTFNGDTFVSPAYYYYPKEMPSWQSLEKLVRKKTKSCAILATYRAKFDRYIDGGNVDLAEYRQNIAFHLQKSYGHCDIFGRNWPKEVRLAGESRGAGWQHAKQSTLINYAFNLACENTVAYNYVTEKIWHALHAGCVAIYYGKGSGIDQILRPESYLDLSQYRTAEDLHARMTAFSEEDRVEMLRSAHEDMSEINKTHNRKLILNEIKDKFIERIRQI